MKKLIIIDDEEFVLEQLCEALNWNEIGFEIEGAFKNGLAALEYIKENHIDTVLTDIKMPHMDGLTLAKIIKENYPDIRVVIISAFRDFEYARQAMQYGVMDYITKPIVYKDFHSTMKNISEKQNEEIQGFLTTEKLEKYQHLFSNLMLGILKDEQILKDELLKIGISNDPSKTPAYIINLHINDFDDYIKTIWKQGKTRLYNGINQLIPFENEKAYFFMIRYVQSNIEIISLSKNNNVEFKEAVSKFTSELTKNLSEILKISVQINVIEYFPSLISITKQAIQTPITEENRYNDTINSAIKYINKNYGNTITLESVSKYIGMSPVYFSAYFKQHTGENYINFLSNIRIEKARKLLLDKTLKISAICNMVGYKNATNFYNIFKQHNDNLTPAQYRNKYTGN